MLLKRDKEVRGERTLLMHVKMTAIDWVKRASEGEALKRATRNKLTDLI